jgi:hypothetical protein
MPITVVDENGDAVASDATRNLVTAARTASPA